MQCWQWEITVHEFLFQDIKMMISQLVTIRLFETQACILQRISRTHTLTSWFPSDFFLFLSFLLVTTVDWHGRLCRGTLSSTPPPTSHTPSSPLSPPQSNTSFFWSVDFLEKCFAAPPHHPTPKSVYWCIRAPAFIWGYGPSILGRELFIVIYCIRECFPPGMWGLKGMVMCWTD